MTFLREMGQAWLRIWHITTHPRLLWRTVRQNPVPAAVAVALYVYVIVIFETLKRA